MNDYLRAQINENCQAVKNGAKAVSFLSCQTRYKKEAQEIVDEHELFCEFEKNANGWYVIYIFKNETLKIIIAELPAKPQTPSEHALLGFLCGYDIDSICKFVREKT